MIVLVQIEGEGVYACFNKGSCIGPDTCDCADGWEGYDCNTRACFGRCRCRWCWAKFTCGARFACLS